MTLLTIAIPTFNRSNLLDNQLSWLFQSILGYETKIEILLSDNCSTDNTPDIIKKWHESGNNVSFRSHRNSENVGVMRNIAYCLQHAASEYVWVIGDDDYIQPQTLPYIINNLKQHPDLTLLTLNYSLFDVPTNSIKKESRFVINQETIYRDGAIENDLNGYPLVLGLGFMSAQIYRTKTVQLAVTSWASDLSNIEVQIYWGAFCAMQGSFKVTKSVYVKYNCGDNALAKPKNWFECYYYYAPVVYLKMLEIGYTKRFIKNLIFTVFFKKYTIKAIIEGTMKWPILGIKVIKILGLLLVVCYLPTKNPSNNQIKQLS
jgi:abequosyltransferase